jgi:hypothetical protein
MVMVSVAFESSTPAGGSLGGAAWVLDATDDSTNATQNPSLGRIEVLSVL